MYWLGLYMHVQLRNDRNAENQRQQRETIHDFLLNKVNKLIEDKCFGDNSITIDCTQFSATPHLSQHEESD